MRIIISIVLTSLFIFSCSYENNEMLISGKIEFADQNLKENTELENYSGYPDRDWEQIPVDSNGFFNTNKNDLRLVFKNNGKKSSYKLPTHLYNKSFDLNIYVKSPKNIKLSSKNEIVSDFFKDFDSLEYLWKKVDKYSGNHDCFDIEVPEARITEENIIALRNDLYKRISNETNPIKAELYMGFYLRFSKFHSQKCSIINPHQLKDVINKFETLNHDFLIGSDIFTLALATKDDVFAHNMIMNYLKSKKASSSEKFELLFYLTDKAKSKGLDSKIGMYKSLANQHLNDKYYKDFLYITSKEYEENMEKLNKRMAEKRRKKREEIQKTEKSSN